MCFINAKHYWTWESSAWSCLQAVVFPKDGVGGCWQYLTQSEGALCATVLWSSRIVSRLRISNGENLMSQLCRTVSWLTGQCSERYINMAHPVVLALERAVCVEAVALHENSGRVEIECTRLPLLPVARRQWHVHLGPCHERVPSADFKVSVRLNISIKGWHPTLRSSLASGQGQCGSSYSLTNIQISDSWYLTTLTLRLEAGAGSRRVGQSRSGGLLVATVLCHRPSSKCQITRLNLLFTYMWVFVN